MTVTLPPTRPLVRFARVSVVRLLAWGVAVIALAAALGYGIEISRFGRSDAAAAQLAEQTIRETVTATSAATEQAAASAASRAHLPPPDNNSQDAVRRLFDVASSARGDAPGRDALALTIYDANGNPLAWSGRASDLPADRVRGGPSVFVVSSPLGLRLVAVRPIPATTSSPATGSAVADADSTRGPKATIEPDLAKIGIRSSGASAVRVCPPFARLPVQKSTQSLPAGR